METNLDKTALRKRLRSRRRMLAAERRDAGEQAAARLPLEALPPFDSFAVYRPLGSEIDPGPLLARLLDTGAEPALPTAIARDQPLEFRLWDSRTPLQLDALGIPAPPAWADTVEPDLVVCPLLAFDRRGGRLGQGAGHYDRTLSNLRATKPVFVLGLAFAGQELDEIPMEPHDQRLDAILTETDFISVARDTR